MNLRARIYNPYFCRFLSVDPLFEAFPNQSPYSYSFNNPISYKDPSGLAPEKEKGNKNQIQGGLLEYIINSIFGSEVEEQNSMDGLKKNVTDDGEVVYKEEDELSDDGGGNSGGGDRTGSNESNNGLGNGVTAKDAVGKDGGGINSSSASSSSNNSMIQGPNIGKVPHLTVKNDLMVYGERISNDVGNNSSNSIGSIVNGNNLLDLGSSLSQEEFGRIRIGDNFSFYSKGLFKNSVFKGNQYVKTLSLAKIGQYTGYASLVANGLINGYQVNQGQKSVERAIIDISVSVVATRIGGYWGILFGFSYEGLIYEFQDSRIPFESYNTGNYGLFPADNTRKRTIIKFRR